MAIEDLPTASQISIFSLQYVPQSFMKYRSLFIISSSLDSTELHKQAVNLHLDGLDFIKIQDFVYCPHNTACRRCRMELRPRTDTIGTDLDVG